MWAYIHKACGKAAFLLTEMPKKYAVCDHSKAQHLDGSPIEPYSAMICDSCGKQIENPPQVENIIPWGITE